jgi:hypothetical protein
MIGFNTSCYEAASHTGSTSAVTIASLAGRCMDALVPEVIDGRSEVSAAA